MTLNALLTTDIGTLLTGPRLAHHQLKPKMTAPMSNSMKGIQGMITAVLSVVLTTGAAAQSASSFDGN